MKRSITAPLVGLGIGATALGGATYVGSSTRCDEGRVVDTLAQCQSLVGLDSAGICNSAFAVTPGRERLDVVQRAVFLRTGSGAPSAEQITRSAGDQRWLGPGGLAMDPYRRNCSSSRSGSSTSSGSSSRSGWSGSSSSSSSVAHLTSRGGFGSSGFGGSGG